jgi:NAD+ diphosphatase
MDHYSRSARTAYSGLTLNRKPRITGAPHETGQPPRQAYILVRGDDVLFDPDLEAPLLLSPGMLTGCSEVLAESIPLGDDGETSYFALSLDRLPEDTARCLAALGTFSHLRGRTALLPPSTAALLGYARTAADWHSRTRFCSFCGHPTAPRPCSTARVCTNPSCGMEHFPRINPAMIVLVHRREADEEYCLLGRQRGWKSRVYSAVSGYVEPGESAEDAVLREVMEETGIAVTDIRYFCSQPWPFSNSLMLGFHARATTTYIRLDDAELEDARWFARSELLGLLASGEIALPAHETIARHLFDAWYAADLHR